MHCLCSLFESLFCGVCSDTSRLCWYTAPALCDCYMKEQEQLVCRGYDSVHTDPVATASHFLATHPEAGFADVPFYLVCQTCQNGHVYVTLGATCRGKILIDLAPYCPCSPVTLYTVCRYACVG